MLAFAALLAVSMPTAAQSVTAVCLRTSQVQAAIVEASPASACGGVTEAHLAALTELDVAGAEITSLKAGDFSGLTALENLELQGNKLSSLPANVFSGLTSLTELQLQANQLSSLPAGVFSGLTSLATLRLWNNQLSSLPAGVFSGLTLLPTLELDGNPGAPLPVAVSLASAGEGQFKAVMPTGAPFTVTLPVSVANGVIDGGATALTIPVGAVESEALSVTRSAGTVLPVTGDIGMLPGLPAGHLGYVLRKAPGLPVEILPAVVSEVSITADAATVTEGEAAVFTVKRTGDVLSTGLTVGVEVSEDGAMLDGTPPTAVTFVAESATAALSVATASDTTEEANSVVTARVAASSDGAYTLSEDPSATVTVEDDDKPPVPVAPGSLVAATYGPTQIDLCWDAPTDTGGQAITGYRIEVSTDSGSTWSDLVADTESTASTHEDSGLTPGATRHYQVSAITSNGVGASSNVAFATTDWTTVCLRTSQVQAAIVEASPADACGGVTEAHLAALTELDVAGAEITSLNAGDFSGLTSLTELRLEDNELSSLPANVFSGLTALAKLHLEDNELSSLPEDVFSGLTALEVLQLQGNKLSSLPANVFSGLTSLTELQLQANQLSSLPAGVFSGLTSLATLRLWNNQLSSLPAGVFSGLTLLPTLELDGNPGAPLPVAVSLAPAGMGRFKAVVATGAPFAVTLPVSVTNGVIDGGAAALTISVGAIESGALSVTRSAGTVLPVTGDIGTLPGLPEGHRGYALRKAPGLPVEILPAVVSEVSITADAATVTEGEAAVFTVKRTGGVLSMGLTVGVEVSEDGAMLDGTPPTEVTFGAGSATAALSVATENDTGEEANSVVTARVTASSGGAYTLGGNSSATVTIEDDDKPPSPTLSMTVAPDAIAEAGTESATVTVSASPAFTADRTISLTFSGTATVTADYTIAVDGTTLSSPYELTLPEGDASIEATVTAVDDTVVEGAETIRIEAMLDGELIGDQQTITITDDDGTMTNHAPVFADGESTTRSVPENAEVGDAVGARVEAADPDEGDTVTYSLGGVDGVTFGIHDMTGQIITAVALDHETRASYSVIVTATDAEDVQSTIDVTISVTNVNEAPLISGETAVSIDENKRGVFKPYTAVDPDGDDVIWNLLGGPDADSFVHFPEMDELVLVAESGADFETPGDVADPHYPAAVAGDNVYHVIIGAGDAGGEEHLLSVTITVNDVDEKPEFTEAAKTAAAKPFAVPETLGIGIPIGAPGQVLTATDPDAGDADPVLTLGGTGAIDFAIAANGQIRVAAQLDSARMSTYELTVTARDPSDSTSDSSLFDTLEITINIQDVNREPVLNDGSGTEVKTTFQENGTGIAYEATATDPDGNNTLTWSVSGLDAAAFRIGASLDGATGSLYFNSSPNFENPGDLDDPDTLNVNEARDNTYQVTVTATDPSNASDSIVVTVSVTNVDEPGAVTLSSNQPQVDTALTAVLTDPDGGVTGLSWQWARSEDGSSGWTNIPGATSASYTPTATDAGSYLRTTASYADAEGGGKTAQAVSAKADLWTATLTPGEVSGGWSGYCQEDSTDPGACIVEGSHDNYGGLTDKGFGSGTTSYTVHSLRYGSNQLPAEAKLHLTLNAALSAADVAALVLRIGSQEFQLSSASTTVGSPVSSQDYSWSVPSRPWTVGASIEVTITRTGAVPPLDKADLRALSVNGTSVTGFNSATLSYTFFVANDVAEATVRATTADSGATVAYSPAQPVALTEGGNTVMIVVTAGAATTTYTVTITRAVAAVTPPPTTGGSGRGSVNWVPQFAEGATATRFVAENTEPGENIGAPVTATDLDPDDTLAYVLEGHDAEFFDVHPATGQLRTKAPLDYETRESYILTVEVSDDWRNYGSIEVTITVTDVDEAPPMSRSAAIAYAENGAGPVAVYVAMAAEGSTVAWSLSGEDAAVFAIDGGTLGFRTQPDYEAPVDADGDNM